MANSNIAVGNGVDALDGGSGNDLLLAEPLNFSAPLQTLNGSGVTGQVRVSFSGDELRVQVDATGLELGQHPMHIHGLSGNGAPLDTPVSNVGPELLPLAPFPNAADGSIAFDQAYSLSSLANAADLFPLDFRVIEVHGVGAQPVAAAELQVQPLQTFAAQGDQGISMSGGNGDDRMIGGHGNDIMNGGSGADVLAGGGGDDDLVGGRDADRFVVGQGKDVITDFNAAEGDRLVFGHDNASPALVLHDTQQGTWIIEGNAAVTDPNSEGVLLLGVHAASVSDAGNWFA